MDIYYFLTVILLLIAIVCVYRYTDKEKMYFRFDGEDIFEINYQDYVNHYQRFNRFSQQLSEYLTKYMQTRLKERQIVYKNLQLSAKLECNTVTITCYLNADKRKYLDIQQEILLSDKLTEQIQAFYQQTVTEQEEYTSLLRLKS